jgi:hypothetical protein
VVRAAPTAPSRADARFLSPVPIARAALVGNADGWGAALAQASVEVDIHSPDAAIGPAGHAQDAIATGAPVVIVEGRSAERELRRAGLEARTYLVLPNLTEPQAFVPIGSRVTRYALSTWLVPWNRRKVVRNAVVGELAARRIVPLGPRFVTIGSRKTIRPFLAAAAERLGVDRETDWFLAAGHGDLLARGAFMLFRPGTRFPTWALKFCRMPGPDDRIDHDARGLRIAGTMGRAAAPRAPRFVGRLEIGGYHASLETAAPGRRVNGVLSAVLPGRAKRQLIERIVEWLTQIARETAAATNLLEPERGRMRQAVLPHWIRLGAPADLVDRLPPLCAVLQHNDLGTWNLVTQGDDFTALDWEGAKAHGFPLWDALYFLSDALASVDGVEGDDRPEHFRRLFLGELPASRVLDSSLARVADASGVPVHAFGPLATLCWLDHALAHRARRDRSRRYQLHAHDPGWMIEQMATTWLTTPGLGPDWDAVCGRLP